MIWISIKCRIRAIFRLMFCEGYYLGYKHKRKLWYDADNLTVEEMNNLRDNIEDLNDDLLSNRAVRVTEEIINTNNNRDI